MALPFSAAQAASAMTLPCNGLGKYDGWTTTTRFRLKTFQGNPQKGNSSSSGPYEPGRSYRPVIIASRGQNKNCSQRHAAFINRRQLKLVVMAFPGDSGR